MREAKPSALYSLQKGSKTHIPCPMTGRADSMVFSAFVKVRNFGLGRHADQRNEMCSYFYRYFAGTQLKSTGVFLLLVRVYCSIIKFYKNIRPLPWPAWPCSLTGFKYGQFIQLTSETLQMRTMMKVLPMQQQIIMEEGMMMSKNSNRLFHLLTQTLL